MFQTHTKISKLSVVIYQRLKLPFTEERCLHNNLFDPATTGSLELNSGLTKVTGRLYFSLSRKYSRNLPDFFW